VYQRDWKEGVEKRQGQEVKGRRREREKEVRVEGRENGREEGESMGIYLDEYILDTFHHGG
jgi:hypothetical protein